MALKIWLTLALLLWPLSAWAVPTTYYVDRLLPGNNLNNGTSPATPFFTIQRCLDKVVAGDTCLVKNGTYPENLSYSGPGGTGALPIIIKDFPGHFPVISFADTSTANSRFFIGGTTATTPVGYFTIEGFEITHFWSGAIKIDNGDHVTIRRNHIHASSAEAVTAVDGLASDGILAKGQFITIDRNLIHRIGYCNGGPSDTVNPAHCDGHGMYLTGTNYTVTNNLVYDFGYYGMQLAAYAFNAAKFVSASYAGFSTSLIANNTIAWGLIRSGIVLYGGGPAPTGQGPGNNNVFENNLLFQNVAPSFGIAQGIYWLNVNGTNNQVTNNYFWDTVGDTLCFSSQFIAAGNSCNLSNPNFVNGPTAVPASPDLHLTSGSGAINFGLNLTSVAPTLDFDGVQRPAIGAWEAGAYEFASSTSLPQELHVAYAFNDGSGTTALDSTANSLNGTLVNGPTWVSGHTGTAVHFLDQVNDFVAVPFGSGINVLTQPLTICQAIFPDPGAESATRTYFGAPLGTAQSLFLSDISGTWSMGIQGSTAAANSEFPVQAGWTYLCLRLNAGTATLFVNGVKGTSAQSAKTYTAYALTGNLQIGSAPGFGTSVAPGGKIDDFALYTQALTDADLLALFTAWNNLGTDVTPPAAPTGVKVQ